MKPEMKRLIIANLPYLLFVYLFGKLGQTYRLAAGADLSEKLLHLADGFSLAFESAAPSFHLFDLAVGVAGAVALRLMVYCKSKNAKKYRRGVEYGSARWGSPKDIAPYIDPVFDNNILLTQTERLTMNNRPKDPKTARNKNVLVIGGSGSGKTRFFVKPNLMQCVSKDYPTSFVITDPKGSLIGEVGQLLVRCGYRVKVLNTINFSKSMHYNPFAYLRTEKDILKLVNTIIVNTKGEGAQSTEDFWVKAERLYYTALIGYIHYEAPEEEKNFITLLDMINASDTREDDEDYKNPVDLLFDRLEEREPEHFAVKQYRKYKLAAGKTAKSILVTASVRLAAFIFPQYTNIMQRDEMDFGSLGERKRAIFCITPVNDGSMNYLVSMLFTQCFQELYLRADERYDGRLPLPVRVIQDEWANVPQPDSYPKVLATCRSYNIGIDIIVQNIQSIKARYRDEYQSIIGNCDTLLFLGGGNEPESLEFMSKLLGKETISIRTRGQTRGRSGSSSINYQLTGRELMTPDEIRRMPTRDALLLIRGESPVRDRKYNIKKHPNYRYTQDGGAKPYIHNPPPVPDYALTDLPYVFRTLDDYTFLEDEHEIEET